MTCINCMDRIQNQDETDVDCGGTICAACAPGLRCLGNSDCASMICDGPTGLCNAPGCGDGILNVTAGEDCDDGGESPACNADCTPASCGDGIVNAAAGVYGVPTYLVEDEMWFGREHLPRVAWILGGRQGPPPDVANRSFRS